MSKFLLPTPATTTTTSLRPPTPSTPPLQMATCIDCRRRPNSSPTTPLSFTIAETLIDRPLFPANPPPSPAADTSDAVWSQITADALSESAAEPILSAYLFDLILRHNSLQSALADHLSKKLSVPRLIPAPGLRDLFAQTLTNDRSILRSARADLLAARDRDPACDRLSHCFLYYKGFLACQAHRIAHRLWAEGRRAVATMIQSRSSEVFAVDIHPAARMGSGILFDHATGVVIGETAVVGDDVSILHNVTLGGTGKETGDRHPKIEDGVLIGAGTQILGRVRVGEGAKVGAGSVVLRDVPARTTAVGNPARLLGGKENPVKLDRLASLTMDHTSWSDYVI